MADLSDDPPPVPGTTAAGDVCSTPLSSTVVLPASPCLVADASAFPTDPE